MVIAIIAGTFLMEPVFPLGDWRWGVVLVAAVLATLWVNKKSGDKWITGDGRQVMRRIRDASPGRAEEIFASFMRRDARQYTHWAQYALYQRLDSGRQVRFLKEHPDFEGRAYDVLWEIIESGETLEPQTLSRYWKKLWEQEINMFF